MFTYLESERNGKNPELVESIKKNLLAIADSSVQKAESDAYGRPLGEKYYWGCNGTVVRQALTLQMAYRLTSDKEYLNTAMDAVSHIFGRNYYGRSYVTGIGYNSPMYPHDRHSAADSIQAPWPGYIVGGGHSATGWVDEEPSYSKNKIAINWQAALVYALAGFVREE